MNSGMTRLATVLLLAIPVAGCQGLQGMQEQNTMASNAKAGKALYDEKCKTVAGEKIYRTVPDVEGVLLMKVRPRVSEREWHDPMWPGAAFASENYADGYINTFLGYEYAAGNPDRTPGVITPQKRGYINVDKGPDGLPGYRFVDVIDAKDGVRHRITGSQKVVGKKDMSAPNVQLALRNDPNYDLNVYSWILDKVPATAPVPRYGVTYEDHVISEDRAIGVASSTVRVLDLQTNEVLGEMIRYAWSRRSSIAASWLTAYKCPAHAVGSDAATRKFVDQILIPHKEK